MADCLQGAAFPGLLSLVYMYLDTLDVDVDSRRRIEEYLDLIRRRTDGPSYLSFAFCSRLRVADCDTVGYTGSLKTAASWIREFVRSHPAYKFDSVVSQEVNYDLMIAIDEM